MMWMKCVILRQEECKRIYYNDEMRGQAHQAQIGLQFDESSQNWYTTLRLLQTVLYG